MNSLELINKLIKDYEKSKERFLHNLKKYPNDEVFTKCVKTREQELQTLQQIKTELEAWEVVKRYTDTSEDTINTEYYFIKSMDSEFETLKKALEVKDNEEIE